MGHLKLIQPDHFFLIVRIISGQLVLFVCFCFFKHCNCTKTFISVTLKIVRAQETKIDFYYRSLYYLQTARNLNLLSHSIPSLRPASNIRVHYTAYNVHCTVYTLRLGSIILISGSTRESSDSNTPGNIDRNTRFELGTCEALAPVSSGLCVL